MNFNLFMANPFHFNLLKINIFMFIINFNSLKSESENFFQVNKKQYFQFQMLLIILMLLFFHL